MTSSTKPPICSGPEATIVPGTAVFLTGNPQGTPTALLHSLKHYNVLHERNVILNVVTAPSPTVRKSKMRRRLNGRYSSLPLDPAAPAGAAMSRVVPWRFFVIASVRVEIPLRK
ncbi:hypothetical protein FHS21_006083 [Phyllobacterium trifolii]|uniref:K+ potassium transporter C-terminal domain-containing protein n=1 Tax=Phyllobacterium trifolii TaxID=300193 RepID=A0A839UMB2_9HYPH|nr:hypothetical protein [Phyllobacterium trifolii]